MTLDRLITGARVFDGRRFREGWNVGLLGDRIAHAGPEAPPARVRTEARGRILSPAFIDTHNHGDFHCLDSENDAMSSLSQGVGTVVVGNCGMSATPGGHASAPILPPPGARVVDLSEHRRRLAGNLPIDVADLIGHGTLRTFVLGSARQAGAEELEQMAGVLDEFLAGGGLGMSVGLNYPEAEGVTAQELARLCKVLGKHGRPLTCHMRNQGGGLMGAVREVATAGEAGGCRVVLSHLRPVPRRYDSSLPAVLDLVERSEHLYMDVYPYTAGCTSLEWFFYQAFGRVPSGAERFPADEVEAKMADLCKEGFEDLSIIHHQDATLVGISVAEAARRRGGGRPGLVAQEILGEDASCVCVYNQVANPESVDRVMLHPKCFLGSDGYLFASTFRGMCHPRSYAAVVRYLTAYVRSGRLPLEAGLEKLTRGPAELFRLSDRGALREGLRANLVLFALENLQERADYARPTLPSGGIDEVILAGQTVWEAATGTQKLRPGTRATPT